MQVREALRWATTALGSAAEAELVLRDVLGVARADLFAHPGCKLGVDAEERVRAVVARRVAGEPLQYITGHQGFRGLDLAVGPGVLVPRPETELVVEQALARLAGIAGPVVVDVGTGSGAIALAIGLERSDAQVWATDASPEALVWAGRNRAALAAAGSVTLLAGDLLAPLPRELAGEVDLVVSNPPYLSAAELASAAPDVREHEPRVALVSGPTGLEVSCRLAKDALAYLRPGGWLVLETSPEQAAGVVASLGEGYGRIRVLPDLAGRPRVIEAQAVDSPP